MILLTDVDTNLEINLNQNLWRELQKKNVDSIQFNLKYYI